MARVTFINAILSGKLAGTIYARNKAGAYIKQYSKPLDPKSIAQQTNRSAFGAAAGAWHAKSDIVKGLWNSYGSTIFQAKSSATASPSSGFNSYVSLNTQLQALLNGIRVCTVSAPSGTTVTFGDFVASDTPPAKAMGSQIQDASGNPVTLSLKSATLVSASGAVTATFTIGGLSAAVPVFLDSNNSTPVGIELQISIPKTQVANYITGKNNQCVGVIAPPTLTNLSWSGNIITFSMATGDLDISKFKTWVSEDQVVEMDAYLVSEVGESRHLGAVKLVVS